MRRFSSFLLLTSIFLFANSCQKELNVVIDEPRVEPGDRILAVHVKSPDGTLITDFDLVIEGPKEVNISVSGSAYYFEDIPDGTYTVEVKKDGFIGSSQRIVFNGNDNVGVATLYDYTAYLTRRAEPVAIDHEVGGRFTIEGAAGALGDIEVIVPPGAIAGTGTTNISITPAPAPLNYEGKEYGEVLGGLSLVCEPSGIIFDKPIQLIIPVDPSTPEEFSFGGMVLARPGQGGSGLVLSDRPEDRIEAVKDASGQFVTVEIPHFSTWMQYFTSPDLYYRWTGTGGTGDPELWTSWAVIDQSPSPGQPVSGTFSHTDVFSPPTTAQEEYCNYAQTNLSPQECTVSISQMYSHPGVVSKYIWVEARYRYYIVDLAVYLLGQYNILATFEQAKANPQVIEFNYVESENPH